MSVACMLIRAGGGEEEVEIGLIRLFVWIAEGVDVDVIVIGPMVVAIVRLEQCRIVMASAWLVSTRKIAYQPTPKSYMVASRATDICNSNHICCNEDKERIIPM